MKNYYQILGIPLDASAAEIKSAYKKLSKKYHPDVNDGDAYFESLFKDIQEAKECLSDSERKSAYDIEYNNFFFNTHRPTEGSSSVNQPEPGPSPEEPQKSTGLIFLYVILFIGALIFAGISYKTETHTDAVDYVIPMDSMDIVVDSVALHNTSIDSVTYESQPVTVEPVIESEPVPEPESVRFMANLSAEDRKVISFIQEYYDFYDRDHIFRKPLVKKTDDYNYVVSVEECISKGSFKNSDNFWDAKLINVSIDEVGELKMGRTYW
jgi:hypothetical protein